MEKDYSTGDPAPLDRVLGIAWERSSAFPAQQLSWEIACNQIPYIYICKEIFVASVSMWDEAEYHGYGIWSKGAHVPDLLTRPRFVLATFFWCLTHYSVIYLSWFNSLGYDVCWRMLIKGILETSLNWWAFKGVRRSASMYCLPKLIMISPELHGKTVCPNIYSFFKPKSSETWYLL